MKKQTKALDLGVLQDQAIDAAKAVQLAQSAALKAIAAHDGTIFATAKEQDNG